MTAILTGVTLAFYTSNFTKQMSFPMGLKQAIMENFKQQK